MTRKVLAAICGVLLSAAGALAAFPPLPVPLQLPPGLEENLTIDKNGSYIGDALRVVDCPDNADNPLGTCGNLLFGGVGMWNSHLQGIVHIKFYPPINNISHFEVTHPFNLTGDDVMMTMPQFYRFFVNFNVVLDTFNTLSSGDLNLNTGEVTNLNYSLIVSNGWYLALASVNPKLKPPPFTFPGIYGDAYAVFEQRPDGLLDLTFTGGTFLPLGNNINGDPVRLPMPLCGSLVHCASIQVPGMSLHPHVRITTKPLNDPICFQGCMPIPSNSILEFTVNTRFSDIGDNFHLNIPQLGGDTEGRSQMQGRIQVQFGEQNGDYVPVTFNAMPPSGMLVPPPPFPIPGLSLGLIGHDEMLRFPFLTYKVQETATADDPFDFPVGELNVKTGQIVGGLLWRTFFNQNLLNAILAQNNGRILPQSFFMRGPAFFQTGTNGEYLFRYNGIEFRPYDTFVWPGPDYTDAAHSYTAGAGSVLEPFFRMQAVLTLDAPVATMAGSGSNVLSSFGERFSYSYSIPCNPAGKPASFSYTNTSSGSTGGTFTMNNLSAASCINSLSSFLPPGTYDNISFTGFGKWSKDDNPHFATVHISTAPDAPYVSILIDGGSVSNVNLKPPSPPSP